MATTDVPGIENRWRLFDTAPSEVENRIKDMQVYAQTAFASTMTALQNLQRVGLELRTINRVIQIIGVPIISGNLPSRDEPVIDLSDFQMNFGPLPGRPSTIPVDLGTFPDFPDLVVNPIAAPNESYVSALLTAIKEKMINDIATGNLGIPDPVQAAMFARERERALLEHQNNLDRLAFEWSAGRWPTPNGALQAKLDEAEDVFTNKRLDLSREIMVKSWELAQANMHFIIQYGITLETHIMDWTHNVATLALDASKAFSMNQIEGFKAQSEGVKTKYTAIIERAKAQIEYNVGIIQMYAADINAFASRAKAESDRVTAISNAYQSQASVYQTLVNLDISKAGLDLKVLELKLQEAVENGNLSIKDKDIEARNQEVLSQILAEVFKAAATVGAQLTSGAMAAVHAQVGISASDSANYNYSPQTATPSATPAQTTPTTPTT